MTPAGANIMHHPRSTSAARRLRLASVLLLINRLLIPLACGLLLVSLLTNDSRLMVYGLILTASCVFLLVIQWIAAIQTGCPLCRTPVLAPMRCMRHRKARRFLGSYKLRVAVGIIFMEQFRCPYCNESTAMDVRERLRSSRPRGAQMGKLTRFQ